MDIYRLLGIMANVGAGSKAPAAAQLEAGAVAATDTALITEGFVEAFDGFDDSGTTFRWNRTGYANGSPNVGWSYPG